MNRTPPYDLTSHGGLAGLAQRSSPATPPVVQPKPLFSISQFRDALVRHGVVFPEAIEDAEGFDGERTLSATQAAYDELMLVLRQGHP